MYFSVLPVLVRSNLDSDYKNAKAAKQSYSRQHLTGGKFPLEFKLCYLANGKFAKFYFRLLFKVRQYLISQSQVAKLNFVYIFILQGTVLIGTI